MSGNGDRAPRTAAGAGRLAGQSVLITGAGSGLGRESALLFAAEGASVVVTNLVPARVNRVVEQVRAAGGEAVGATADVRVAQDSVERGRAGGPDVRAARRAHVLGGGTRGRLRHAGVRGHKSIT